MKRGVTIFALIAILISCSASTPSCGGRIDIEEYKSEVKGLCLDIRDTYRELFMLPLDEAQERMDNMRMREEDDNEWKIMYQERAESYQLMKNKFQYAAERLETIDHPDEYKGNVVVFIEYIEIWAKRMDLSAAELVLCINCDMKLSELKNANNDEYELLHKKNDEIQEEIESLNGSDLQGFFEQFGLEHW